MYHSMTFIKNDTVEKNTWDDWHLIPTSRPVFNPPNVKTKYVEIPGSDKVIDLTESLTGYPVYGDREGSLEFIVENGHKEWHEIYSEIMAFLNGYHLKVILEDDISHYYEGRFSVNEWKSNKHWSLIVIDYILNPYKLNVQTSIEEWKWDPFNFENGIIQSEYFRGIEVDSDSFVTYSYGIENLIGRKPVCPIFKISEADSNGVTIKLYNEELDISVTKTFYNGSKTDPDFILSNISSNNSLTIGFKGRGTVSIEFRSGGL